MISIHSPCEGRDGQYGYMATIEKPFQSTLPVKGETRLEGGLWKKIQNFNPLSLWRERRMRPVIRFLLGEFQSTLPVKGETPSALGCRPWWNISIHSPCEGRDGHQGELEKMLEMISIHSPCEGRDISTLIKSSLFNRFQSTLPVKGETQMLPLVYRAYFLFQSTLPVKGET